ncbi:cation acetate symporter [Streptomyces sp. NPDC029006]|uniref:solute symporter family protein n=1 Tax=Streptomyces sp. NPDC029006 TaxID=3155467 RepID=UPI003401F5C8
MSFVSAAAPPAYEIPALGIFAVFVMLLLLLSIGGSATDGDELSEFYLGSPRLSAAFNGLALFGAYLSAASLLGNPGLIALSGYDGILYTIGPAFAWVVVLLVVAEPYRRTARFTIGDVLSLRLHSRRVHIASAVTTVTICLLYLTAQLVGIGALVAPVFGLQGSAGQRGAVIVLGIAMTLFAFLGGMQVTTVVQALKAVAVIGSAAFISYAVMTRFHWSPVALLERATQNSGSGDRFLSPGLRFEGRGGRIDLLSIQLSFALGAAGLPHVLTRISAVSSARKARQSVACAGLLYALFCAMTLVTGLGATALVTAQAIRDNSASGNTALLLLARFLGGSVLVTVIACVAFATIVTMVAGIALTAACSLAHDLYASSCKKGRATAKNELRVARVAVGLVGGIAICGSLYAQTINVSLMVSLAFTIAASSVFPVIVYNSWWKRLTTRGALWGMYGGLALSLSLTFISPAVSGNPDALLPHRNFDVLPLANPGIVSIPLGFFLGWLGSVTGRTKTPTDVPYGQVEPLILTGAPIAHQDKGAFAED